MSSQKSDKEKADAVMEQTRVQQIAGQALMGASETQMAKQFGITRYAVRKVMASPEFKELMSGLASKSLEMALASFKAKMNDLEPLAYNALKEGLIDGKLEAVKLWGTYVGIDAANDEKPQQALTIVMPGAQMPDPKPTIDVTNEPVESDEETVQ